MLGNSVAKVAPERVDEWGRAGDFGGDVMCEGCPLKGKTAGADKQGEMGEKVAKIDFLEVGNHAEIGHLSADKRTKCSDKVFVLKKTFTQVELAPPKTIPILLPILSLSEQR